MPLYFEKLTTLQKNAYAPYSRFQVAAILVLESGGEIKGVNVENASYGATICAERSAFSSSISQYGHQKNYRELHLLAGNREDFIYPCGICCQFISNLVEGSFPIYLYNKQGEYLQIKMEELLPQSFLDDKLPR